MSEHTPEPWESVKALSGSENDRGFNIYGGAQFIGRVSPMIKDKRGNASEEGIANADRIVACVNACAGINPEAVPDVLEALKGMCDAYKELCLMSGYNFHQSGGSRYTAARAALAKAEAKS